MRRWMRRHIGRLVLSAPLVLVGVGVSGLAAQPVGATFTTCNSDPVVALSDGSVVTLSATIGDSAADVQQVHYELRIPRGTSVLGVTYQGDLDASKESLRVHDNEPAGTYEAGIGVITHDQNIPVTATTTLTGTSNASTSVSGYAGQFLTMRLTTGATSSGPDNHGNR